VRLTIFLGTSDVKGGREVEGVREQGAEENIWTWKE